MTLQIFLQIWKQQICWGDENIIGESVLDVPQDKSTTSFTLTKVLKEDGEISTQNGDIYDNTKLGNHGP
jgi:hypothetical protein